MKSPNAVRPADILETNDGSPRAMPGWETVNGRSGDAYYRRISAGQGSPDAASLDRSGSLLAGAASAGVQ